MSQNNAVVSKYYSGQGIILVAKKDPATGKPLGFRNVGNVSEVGVNISTETTDHKESSTGTRGIDLRLTTGITCEVSLMMESFNRENLEMALRGKAETVTGATVASESLTAHLGTTVPLANMNITTFTELTDVGATTTYTEGTDYAVNTEAGSLVILEGGTIPDGDEVIASYEFDSYESVQALTEAAEDYFIRFEGLNTADSNKPVVLEIFRMQPDPLRELALITEQIGGFELVGNAMADLTRPAGTSNYFREMFVA